MIKIYTERNRQKIVNELLTSIDTLFKEHGIIFKSKSYIKIRSRLNKLFDLKKRS